MHAPRATAPKRESVDPSGFHHLPDLSCLASVGGDAAPVVGWPLSAPPHLLGPPVAVSTSPSPPPPALTLSTSSSAPTLEAMAGTGFLVKRTKWTRRLVITKQPASEFYKDEGGKANALEVEVTLVEFDEHGEPARSPDEDFIDIPLRILLFFESGKRVDDTDQEIFRFVGNDYDSIVIRAGTRKAAVQFRLEKVSRRKDGQRFKLRIEVDQEQCTANVADLTPVFTNAICVLSKRKHPNTYTADAASRAKEPAPKLMRRDLIRLEEKMTGKFDALSAQLHHVCQLVQKQNELIVRCLGPMHPMGTPMHGPPSDNGNVLEWLLRSGPDESAFIKTEVNQQLYPSSSMPYFEVPDDPCHDEPTTAVSPEQAASPSPTIPADAHTIDLASPPIPFSDI